MSIVRMYKTDDDGTLVFREAWVDLPSADSTDGTGPDEDNGIYFVVNHGTVGHQSTSKDAPVESAEEAEGMLAAFEEQCVEDGYAAVPQEDQWWVVAQFALKNARVTDRDKYLEQKAKESLTAHLAWRGSGTVEKTEFVDGPHGTGKLNIYCLAPDAAKAVAGIKVCIREAKLDFTKLSIGVAPFSELDAIKLKHGSAAPFSL